MKLTTLAVSAFLATAATAEEVQKPTPGMVKVVNRCSYDVYLFNVIKQIGCTAKDMVLLKKGQSWTSQMDDFPEETKVDDGGVSIKLSKYPTCGGHDITQLEYKIEWTSPQKDAKKAQYNGNYLDMSFVDCQMSGDCPGFKDGFFLKSGNHNSDVATAADVTTCPIFSVANEIQAAKVSYIQPNDVQTKFCPIENDLSLYLCGHQAPSSGDESPASSSVAPSFSAAPSSSAPSSTAQLPSTTSKAASKPSTSDLSIAKAAAVTSVPVPEPEAPKAIKTVIEYVTVSVDAPVKRHAHVHGRRHQRIRA